MNDHPITWRNIEVPDFRGATVGMAAASNNLEAARKLFTQSIADTERIDAENWANTKANNTNAELKHLLGYKDLEGFEKAKQAGEFLTRLDQYGAQIDTDRVLKAIDERADVLRNRAINDLDYRNRVRTEEEARVAREQKPIVDRLLGLVEQGEDVTGAARIYADSGMLREDFLRQINEASRKRKQDDEERTSIINYRNAQTAAARAQATAANAQTAAANAQLKFLRDQYKALRDADSGNEEQVQAWLKESILGLGTLDNRAGRDALEQVINKYKLTPNAAQDVRQNLEELFPGGYYTRVVNGKKIQVPVPVALVDQALAATDEIGDGSFWSMRGNRAGNHVLGLLQDPATLQKITEASAIRDGRLAFRTQAALNPQALARGANLNTGILLTLGEWMTPPKK